MTTEMSTFYFPPSTRYPEAVRCMSIRGYVLVRDYGFHLEKTDTGEFRWTAIVWHNPTPKPPEPL